MPLTMDFSADYLLWDGTQAGTLTSVATAGNITQAVGVALPAQPTDRERAPTGGVYAGFDQLWNLPGPLLGSIKPKPADTWTDAAGVVWTVLATEYDEFDQVWKLTTVDLILANGLKDTVTFYKPTDGQDAGGSRVPTYAAVAGFANIAARIQELTGAPSIERGKRLTAKEYDIFTVARPFPSVEWQIRGTSATLGTVKLGVTAWRNPDRIDELMVTHGVTQADAT